MTFINDPIYPVKSRIHNLSLIMLLCWMILGATAYALHSPQEWYETSALDTDGNKVDDFIDDHPDGELVDVFICFKYDCRPENRMLELEDMGTVGYLSPLLACAHVYDITVDDIVNIVALWPEVGYICANEEVEYFMQTSGEALKAHAGLYSPNTIEDQGFDGTGVTIAIIDSGVDDLTHPDLPTAVGGITMVDGLTGQFVHGNPPDVVGHGTLVAGAALGRGSAGVNRGTAPGASLFDAQIEDPLGIKTAVGIQRVIEWINQYGYTVTPPIKVVNLSIGFNRASDGFHPLTQAINNLKVRNIAVVVAGGNHGTCDTTETYPSTGSSYPAGFGHIAMAREAITVAGADHNGTVDRSDDEIGLYSRVGPGLGYSAKPDITTYGGGCSNPRCPQGGCQSGANNPIFSANLSGGYSAGVGTSIASPQVAGIVACYSQAKPNINLPFIKHLLRINAEDFGPPGWDSVWGAGLIDIANIPGLGQPLPPDPCDLTVLTVMHSPQKVVCNQPVNITVWVKNKWVTPVDTFTIDIKRYYFGPNSNPPSLFNVLDSPYVNDQGPILPGEVRSYQFQWTPGISDSLPLSAHSCFWGIIDAGCDHVINNNKRNENFTLSGLIGNSCGPTPPKKSANADDTLTIRMRLSHDLPGIQPVNVYFENPDPENWGVQLCTDDGLVGEFLPLITNMEECALWIDLKVWRYDALYPLPVEILVTSESPDFGILGDATVVVDPALDNACCEVRGDVAAPSDGVVLVNDLVFLVNYLFKGGDAPECLDAGDCAEPLDASILVNDLVTLVNYLFKGGVTPPPC